MIGPWIHALFERGRRVSDIEFMSVKQFEGKLKKAEGSATGTGTIVSITPATGKTFYLAGAHVQQVATGAVAAYSWHAELKNDTTVVDNVGAQGSATTTLTALPQIFQLKGDSLVGNSSKTYSINIQANSDSLQLEAMIYGYEEDDADDPRL